MRIHPTSVSLFAATTLFLATTAQAQTFHTVPASVCQPVDGHSNVSYQADGSLEHTGTASSGGFTCALDNHKSSSSSTVRWSFRVRDYSYDSGDAGAVRCQGYSSTSFVGSLTWSGYVGSTVDGVSVMSGQDFTAYDRGVVGLYCEVPRVNPSHPYGGISKLYRFTANWL